MNKLLTIAIPTYNRQGYLQECLDRICPQLTKEVELVVRDNCSDNYDFPGFIKQYEKYCITFCQNKVNIGGDANIARLYEECNTPWIWVIGDDDCIRNDAVEAVLKIIKDNPDVVYVKLNFPKYKKTIGINGFTEAMEEKGAFASSYFTSECLVNAERTKAYMLWHYKYLTLQNAQILKVIKYLIDNPAGQCLFTTDKVLGEHGSDITWSHTHFMIVQSLLFELFRDQKKLFKTNIFKQTVQACLVFIEQSNMSFRDKLYFYKLFFVKYGIFNVLLHCQRQLLRIPMRMIFKKQ